jgi:hypothetical protein
LELGDARVREVRLTLPIRIIAVAGLVKVALKLSTFADFKRREMAFCQLESMASFSSIWLRNWYLPLYWL